MFCIYKANNCYYYFSKNIQEILFESDLNFFPLKDKVYKFYIQHFTNIWFVFPSYNVSEGSPVGTSVGLMIASDADEGENAKITFDLITNGGYFRINQMTGNILVSRQLDREAVAIHHMTVYARDNGNIIRISSATVTVTLDDVNDNEPVFAQDQVIVSFQENRSCANSILTITASDADMVNTPNSQIEYFFVR